MSDIREAEQADRVDDGYCIYCDRNFGERHKKSCVLAYGHGEAQGDSRRQ